MTPKEKELQKVLKRYEFREITRVDHFAIYGRKDGDVMVVHRETGKWLHLAPSKAQETSLNLEVITDAENTFLRFLETWKPELVYTPVSRHGLWVIFEGVDGSVILFDADRLWWGCLDEDGNEAGDGALTCEACVARPLIDAQ